MNYWTEACAGNDTGDLPLPPPPAPTAPWAPAPTHLAHWAVPGTERGTIGAHEPRLVWLGFLTHVQPDPLQRCPSAMRELMTRVLARRR